MISRRCFFKPIEDLFVRDALFKREIKDKVKLSAEDVNAAINKSQFKVVLIVLTAFHEKLKGLVE